MSIWLTYTSSGLYSYYVYIWAVLYFIFSIKYKMYKNFEVWVNTDNKRVSLSSYGGLDSQHSAHIYAHEQATRIWLIYVHNVYYVVLCVCECSCVYVCTYICVTSYIVLSLWLYYRRYALISFFGQIKKYIQGGSLNVNRSTLNTLLNISLIWIVFSTD